MSNWIEATVGIVIDAPSRSVWIDLLDVTSSLWPLMFPVDPTDHDYRLKPGRQMRCRPFSLASPKKPPTTWMAEVTAFEPMRMIAVRQWGEVEDETRWKIEPRGPSQCFVQVCVRKPASTRLDRRLLLDVIFGSKDTKLDWRAREMTKTLKERVEGRLRDAKDQREINRRFWEKERAKAAGLRASR